MPGETRYVTWHVTRLLSLYSTRRLSIWQWGRPGGTCVKFQSRYMADNRTRLREGERRSIASLSIRTLVARTSKGVDPSAFRNL